jgi:hypothetical protein
MLGAEVRRTFNVQSRDEDSRRRAPGNFKNSSDDDERVGWELPVTMIRPPGVAA